MYLHIGNNVLVRKDAVIGVFSIDSLSSDNKGKKFMSEIRQNREVEDISDGKQSSLVLTDEKIYITRISTATLLGRSGNDVMDVLKSTPHDSAVKIKKGS